MVKPERHGDADVLLIGPPGTGKTMIGRLIATESWRSFYPLSAADILGGQVGASIKKLSEVFARAEENSPAIIMFF
jgi:SpoVK/Ycf46/Vps4 family AAA+-type ATPase